ncbi:MAG: DUF4340 domain-containing protein [Verrucomicrobia bacterium]|nr:DUF4340 domain-containing protein [Verrucomicrobiota bacterium]
MRTKVTLVLIFLNVALFFFIFKFEHQWRTADAAREARRKVLGPEAANIQSVEVVSATTAANFRLIRERDAWFLTKPLDRWPANPHAVSTILYGLQLLEHETSFTVKDLERNNQTLADFGLDPAKPRLTVTFTSGDAAAGSQAPRQSTSLRIGDSTPDGKRLYVLSPDGTRVHVVNRSLADSLSVPMEQLRSDTLFGVGVFEARSLSLQIAQRTPEAGATTGVGRVRIRRDGTRWTFDAPITARASRTAMEIAIKDLNALRAKAFPASAVSPAPSAAPSMRIALEGTNSRLEVLFLGEPVPAAPGPARAAGAPAATATEFYAQLEGRRALFTVEVPHALLDVLRGAQESLREKHILDFDAAAITAIAIASPLQPNLEPFDLKRIIDTPAGAPRDATREWQLVRRGENPAGPRTMPADPAAMQRLLAQLAGLSARRFKSDAPTSADLEGWGFNRPIREITLATGGGAPPTVLRLGTDANRNVYARVGTANDPGNSIYEVPREILDEFPLAPTAWRDRAVLEPLPATARFSALKLGDLETKQVVYQTAFNAAGEAASSPRDPKALQALLGALRSLRAREYLPGGFTERITAGGDERSWRYLLEATVAVPGSAGTEQTSNLAVHLTERVGGVQQYAGLKELNTVFQLEQPVVDALWSLIYGPRDPGPPPEKKP